MRPLKDELRDVFTQFWRPEDEEAVSWKDDIMAVVPLNLPLQQHLIHLLSGQAPQVLSLLRQDREGLWTYMQARFLLCVLARLEDGIQELQRLASSEDGPYYVGRGEDAAHLLAARNDHQLLPFFRSLVLNNEIDSVVQKIALQALVNAKDTASIKALQTVAWSGDIAQARVRLGDLSALRPLIWSSTSQEANQAIAELETRLGGLPLLLNELISVNPEELQEPSGDPVDQLTHLALHDPMVAVQAWAIRQLAARTWERFSTLIPVLLGQRDWKTLKAASDVLASIQPPPVAELKAILEDRNRSRPMRLWAARTLLHAKLQPDLSDLSELSVALPPEVPKEARDAVVHYWVRARGGVQAGTDVRWLMEGYKHGWEWPDVTEEHEAAVSALQSEGLTTTVPVEAGVWHQEGHGNYVVLEVHGGEVWLSNIARFAWPAKPQDETLRALRPRLERALATVGWRVLSEDAAGVVFPGLNVYHFGRQTSQPLRNLLFYYQD